MLMKSEYSWKRLLCISRMNQPPLCGSPIRQLPAQSLHQEVTVSPGLSDCYFRTFSYVRDLHPGRGLFPCAGTLAVEISLFTPPQEACSQSAHLPLTGLRAVMSD